MIVVTGASQGIGAAIARRVAELDSVCVGYLKNEHQARAVAEDIRRRGYQALAKKADLRHEDQVVELFAIAQNELGPVTGLVNNAGAIGGSCTVTDFRVAQLDDAYNVLFRGLALCSREATHIMARSRGGNGGVILNLSSYAAYSGGAGRWAHYAAMKAAVNTYTVASAKELGPEGIRVNAIAPRYVDTEIYANNGYPDLLTDNVGTVPLGRIGTPDDVAEAAFFLLSPQAAYISGAILDVTGG